MTDPLSAALARLHAAYPDLPEDGGRVWEPVQDEAEDAEAPTPLSRADLAVTEARQAMAFTLPTHRQAMTAALDALVAAVEARYEARHTAPADACPLHSPNGDPCECGHAGGADCHPKES